jgi:hypothetical protein
MILCLRWCFRAKKADLGAVFVFFLFIKKKSNSFVNQAVATPFGPPAKPAGPPLPRSRSTRLGPARFTRARRRAHAAPAGPAHLPPALVPGRAPPPRPGRPWQEPRAAWPFAVGTRPPGPAVLASMTARAHPVPPSTHPFALPALASVSPFGSRSGSTSPPLPVAAPPAP